MLKEINRDYWKAHNTCSITVEEEYTSKVQGGREYVVYACYDGHETAAIKSFANKTAAQNFAAKLAAIINEED